MRDAFITRLTERARLDPSVTLVVGDLGYNVVTEFAHEMPNQFLNAGVAEQAMMGAAAGMAADGRRVFVYSIANFPTLRCLEQIRNDVCYHNLDVAIVAIGAGLSYGSLGYSHHAVEDIAAMRAFPHLTICSPGDPYEVHAAVDQICDRTGPFYLRLGKSGEPVLHSGALTTGIDKPQLLADGSDLTLAATGGICALAMEVSRELSDRDGLSLRVVSVPTIKPLDADALLEAMNGTSGLVTIEEHAVAGGFGSAVLEAFAAKNVRVPVQLIGLPTDPLEVVGSREYLLEKAGLSKSLIRERVLKFAFEYGALGGDATSGHE